MRSLKKTTKPSISCGVEADGKAIESVMVGEMGIKQAIIGEKTVYNRTGSYFYLELKGKDS